MEPYPGPGPVCKLSVSGGAEPHWSKDRTELFYRQGTTAMVANVADRNFCDAESHTLFVGLAAEMWGVSPTSDMFVTVEPRELPRLHIVLDWFQELKANVPIGGSR